MKRKNSEYNDVMGSTREIFIKRYSKVFLIVIIISCIFIVVLSTINPAITFIAAFLIVVSLTLAIFAANSRIKHLGTPLPVINHDSNSYSCRADRLFKQLVIDIVWELRSRLLVSNSEDCEVKITTPSGKTDVKHIISSNVEHGTGREMLKSVSFSIYNREGFQHIINDSEIGEYKIQINAPSPGTGFKILSVTLTGWN